MFVQVVPALMGEPRFLEDVRQFASFAFRAQRDVNMRRDGDFKEFQRSLLSHRDSVMKRHARCGNISPQMDRLIERLYLQSARVVHCNADSPRSIAMYLHWLAARAWPLLRHVNEKLTQR